MMNVWLHRREQAPNSPPFIVNARHLIAPRALRLRGNLLVSIAADGIRVWSLGENRGNDWRERQHISQAGGAPTTKVDFEGGAIATANGHSLIIWDMQEGLLLHTIPQTVKPFLYFSIFELCHIPNLFSHAPESCSFIACKKRECFFSLL